MSGGASHLADGGVGVAGGQQRGQQHGAALWVRKVLERQAAQERHDVGGLAPLEDLLVGGAAEAEEAQQQQRAVQQAAHLRHARGNIAAREGACLLDRFCADNTSGSMFPLQLELSRVA